MEKKTSKDWLSDIPLGRRPIILDPDGWDRKNYNYSFNEELISKEEFFQRLCKSTVGLKRDENGKTKTFHI